MQRQVRYTFVYVMLRCACTHILGAASMRARLSRGTFLGFIVEEIEVDGLVRIKNNKKEFVVREKRKKKIESFDYKTYNFIIKCYIKA
jgi:hypothetical protein